jgi:hypothetical protein
MTQAQAQALLAKEFDYCVTEAEEALLDMLEAEWLARQRAVQLEDFDFWTLPNSYKAGEVHG